MTTPAVGDRSEVSDEERGRLGRIDGIALLLISVGSVLPVPFVGWTVGIVLVWLSRSFRTSQKWLATLVWPFGFAAPLSLPLVFGGECVGDCGISASTFVVWPLILAALLAQAGVVAVLYHRARRAS